MDVATAWVVGLASMLVVLIVAWRGTGSFRAALIYTLVWGKILATVYWLVGLDKPLLQVYYVEGGVWHRVTVLTAANAIFLSFLLTNLTVIFWPWIARELRLPRRIP